MKNKHMEGSIEFYAESEIINTKTFLNPEKKLKDERREVFVYDRKNVYMVMKGLFCEMTGIEILAVYKRFLKRVDTREKVMEISRIFYTEHNNTAKNISEITGYHLTYVNNVISNKLLSKDEIIP